MIARTRTPLSLAVRRAASIALVALAAHAAAPACASASSPEVQPATATPTPPWVVAHWERLVGRWVADNTAYRSDAETFDAYSIEWSWGLGKASLTGRLFGLEGGEEAGTFWEFREFWHPGTGRLTAEQFGADGVYGVGSQERLDDGKLEMAQVFYSPGTGAVSRIGHRSWFEGQVHVTESFDIDENGVWKPRRVYRWQRPDEKGGSGSDR